jgi:2-hydroxy-6-oxonona-2,4-dienedioate hydrolase
MKPATTTRSSPKRSAWRRALRAISLAALLGAVAGTGSLALEFRKDLHAHRQRIAAGSRLVQTACGPIEVAEAGEPSGAPLLVIHGSGGGFDQGLALAADYAPRGYRVIAPSRFGYLRTPFPDDPSGQRQADHLACLLDALKLREAALLGFSAGGISALHFAARHPERTRALVLVVPAVYRPDPAVPTPAWALRVLDAMLAADLPFWLMAKLAPDATRRLVLATPAAVYAQADSAERERADAMLRNIVPVSARRLGLLNDSRLTTGAARADLEAIRAPTLCISARDDGFGTYESARYSTDQISGARLLDFERGGHLLLGHQAEVVAAVDALLREVWRQPPS